MERVTVRELRNNGGSVLDKVSRGATVIVTRDGADVAELRPVHRAGLSLAELNERWRSLPRIDADTFRSDVDSVLDQSL